ncbi:hypothetical protein evm_012268 [Chilo suppressalis]|nr:hypothetical protein evm_012268 [Chilo suppressalis]
MDGIGRLGRDPPRGPSADWRVLTTADAAGTDGLMCLPKHGGTRIRQCFIIISLLMSPLLGHWWVLTTANAAGTNSLTCLPKHGGVFARHGLVAVSPLREKFDPNLHEALFQQEVEGAEPGTVVAVSKVGYKLHERCVRPALVGVAKGPSS